MRIKGVRTNGSVDASAFIKNLTKELSIRHIARCINVSDKTVRRWISGKNHIQLETLMRIIDILYPQSQGSLPIYSPEMGIDGNTRLGGVGNYSKESAR